MVDNYYFMDDSDDDDGMWEDPTVYYSCARLRWNDPSVKAVDMSTEAQHGDMIASALVQGNNTMVEKLTVDFRMVPPTALGNLNQYIVTSPSLKEFDFGLCNGSGALWDENHTLQHANLLLFSSSCGENSVETMTSVPLCQSTALTLTTALRVNKELRNLSIAFLHEDLDEDDDEDAVVDLIRNSFAPAVAGALGSSSVESLSLDWLEHEAFSTGVEFLSALPGCLPASLKQLELNNHVDADPVVDAIVSVIQQSGPKLDSILLAFCKFGDESFQRILHALMQYKSNIKVLHYGHGILHPGTAPVFAQSIAQFGKLVELGVGFQDSTSIEAFEVFVQQLPHTETVKTFDIQLSALLQGMYDLKRVLRAVAVAMTKLPNLCSISSVYRYTYNQKVPVVKKVPREFLKALDAHKHLVNFIPQLVFDDKQLQLVEYYLTRNRFRDRLGSTKKTMIESFQALDNADVTNPMTRTTLVKETLCARDDWLQPGIDQGKPLPSTATDEEGPINIRRFQPGLLF